ncbi:MAG: 1-acyl-sn-glycerol-3-phosphate acyltransferase [Clostridiales bacterium]|nr:1-acyl-sn-glycerol-3-phosphate acyltransferase [Clostridiales bacterium]
MEKQKLTVAQKIHSRKMKTPPAFIYRVLGGIWKMLFTKKYGVEVEFKTDFRKEKGPYIVVSNHASRADYIFTGVPLLPNTYNYVAGYNEFHRSHLSLVFKLLNVIPKKNFTPDIYTIKEVSRVLKSGGRVVIFPEGMSSISGANQPVALGTGKFIKHFNLPVYYAVIKGGYLTCPKYNLKDRYGKVKVTFDRMFTPEELAELSPEQIEDKMNRLLYHDDYKWNKQEKIAYKNDGNIADDLHDLLYWCPKCGKEFTMVGEGNTIRCTACGNGAKIDDTYEMTPFNDTCVIPETQTEWFNLERERIKEMVQDESFELCEEVELGNLPDFELLKEQKTSEIVGKGKLRLNRQGLTYEGTRNGEKFSFHLTPAEVPTYGMCTDVSRFYTFYKGEFMEFYPKTRCVEKWFMATEEIHRITGGKWQDFKFEK